MVTMKSKILFTITTLILVLANTSAYSATIFVDSKNQGVQDGKSWATAFSSLHTALSGLADGDTIKIMEGLYETNVESWEHQADSHPFSIGRKNVQLLGSYCRTSPTVVDLTSCPTTLKGVVTKMGYYPEGIVQISLKEDGEIRIENVHILGEKTGQARFLPRGLDSVDVKKSNRQVVLFNVEISNTEYGIFWGPGNRNQKNHHYGNVSILGKSRVYKNIYGIWSESGLVILQGETEISENEKYGIRLQHLFTTNLKLVVEDRARIISNGGGGIYCGSGHLSMRGESSVAFNKRQVTDTPNWIWGGGGIRLGQCKLVMSENASIHNNTVSLDGGGISLSHRASLIMEGRSRIYSNHADREGGGVFVEGTHWINWPKVTLKDFARIEGNSADIGGGMASLLVGQGGWWPPKSIVIQDHARVTQNFARQGGGFKLHGSFYLDSGSTSRICQNNALEFARDILHIRRDWINGHYQNTSLEIQDPNCN